ncbi:phage putative head morphogenesis protein, SPP1 gp7 family [Peptostreptococcus sp. D1]|nr:phage putative head morphogenesis protein, SPP1 gp7 family [Peptostreptococcus sp. D1]
MYEVFDVKDYEYLATLDIKTSEICRNLDGKKFSLSEAVPGVNYPPMHPHCRSTTVPVDVDDLEDSVRIARDENGKNIYVDSNLSYREWYKKYVETNPQYLLKEKKWKNRHVDKKQYEDYKIKYGKEIPKSFEKFQNMKYNNTNKLEEIKERHSLKKSIFSSEKSLDGHFNKHNSEFGYKNKEEYLKKSQELLGKAESENIHRYKTKSGRHVVYDKKSNEIVIYDKGKIKTYMKPNNGYEYYLEQYRKDIENE